MSRGRGLLFISGTRADYSKLQPLIEAAKQVPGIDPSVFVTGMHMLQRYGSTHKEIEPVGEYDYRFINQSSSDDEYLKLSKTVQGIGDYLREVPTDIIVVHGDRIEALAGAIVGVLMNTLVAHVEGGEVSGTQDESLRHAISKLAHIHFVANEEASSRLESLGEDPERIFTIGSPELDLMNSRNLPSLEEVCSRYNIPFTDYGIAILHPVTTELDRTGRDAEEFVEALNTSPLNWIVIESNNDQGSALIRKQLSLLAGSEKARVLPSMRYPYFLTLLKNSQMILGNSSTGVREAPHYGVPAVNVGTRQSGRASSPMIMNVPCLNREIQEAIGWALSVERVSDKNFGDGNSAKRFRSIISSEEIWSTPIQKRLVWMT